MKKLMSFVMAASMTASSDFINRPVETTETVLYGTNNILKLARDKKVKQVVYLSTMEVYGVDDWQNEKVTEEQLGYIDILKPRSSYPESKRLAENLCVSYWSEYGVPVKIARLAQTFGPGVTKDDNRVFAQFAKSVINKNNIVLHTTGKSVRNYCYIRDCILAILTLLTKGENGQAYTVANEESCVSIKEMAEMVAKDIANGDIKVIIDIPKDIESYGYAPEENLKLSSKKIESLGWKAKIGLEESYRRMIESMRVQNE